MTGRRMMTHRSAPEPCPYCGKTLDADTGATPGGGGPKPGDVGICWGCAAPLVFDENLRRRRPTPAETVEIAGNRDVQAAIRVARGGGDRRPIPLSCPVCPLCGQPPMLILAGEVQAFCGNDDCTLIVWNPSVTLDENLTAAGVVRTEDRPR